MNNPVNTDSPEELAAEANVAAESKHCDDFRGRTETFSETFQGVNRCTYLKVNSSRAAQLPHVTTVLPALRWQTTRKCVCCGGAAPETPPLRSNICCLHTATGGAGRQLIIAAWSKVCGPVWLALFYRFMFYMSLAKCKWIYHMLNTQ